MSEAESGTTTKRSLDKEDQDSDYKEGGNKRFRSYHGDNKVTMRLLIPLNTAGAIIGKGGTNIRDLRKQYNANVQVPDSDGVERIVTATTRTVEDAANLSGRIVEALNERMHSDNDYGQVRMLVHKSQAGTIIGLGGKRIKEMREDTGAVIKVNQNCCPESTDRICFVKGKQSNIIKAVGCILEMLQKAQPKGFMNNYDPNLWDDSYDYGGYNRFDNRGGGDSHAGDSRNRGFNRGDRFNQRNNTGGGNFRDRRNNNQQGRNYNQGGYNAQGRGGGSGGGFGYQDNNYDNYQQDNFNNQYNEDFDNADNLEENTTQVTVPTDLVSSIIGKGGMRIRQIRQDSGAMITIDEPGKDDRIITIVGTAEQTQNAQYLLQRCVKLYGMDQS